MAADLPGPLTNTVTITAVSPASEPITVTTAVTTHLEPYTLYLPLIINSATATAGDMDRTAVAQPAPSLFVNSSLNTANRILFTPYHLTYRPRLSFGRNAAHSPLGHSRDGQAGVDPQVGRNN
jgi:hypothetical protein